MNLNLFPSLVKAYDLSGYSRKSQLLHLIHSLKAKKHNAVVGGVSNYSLNDMDSNSDFLTKNNFTDLTELLQKGVKDYSKEVGIVEDKISDTWFNIMTTGGYTIRHSHPGSSISGAYYPKIDQGSCNLIFHSPISNIQSTWYRRDPTVESSIYIASENIISIKEDHLYIFPSWLEHSTEVNRGFERIVISFNVNPWS